MYLLIFDINVKLATCAEVQRFIDALRYIHDDFEVFVDIDNTIHFANIINAEHLSLIRSLLHGFTNNCNAEIIYWELVPN